MLKLESDPIYVRASVATVCNLRCSYCPIDEGMENRVPDRFAGQRLSTAAYVRSLILIAASGIRGVSFTGGEPTLCSDLGRILDDVRPHFDRVELTTNGARLDRVKDAVRRNVDLLKVSLDTVRDDDFASITGRAYAMSHARKAIEWAVGDGIRLGINVVLMRRTLADLRATITFARKLAADAEHGQVHLSLLDFYYSPTRRTEWQKDFLPTSQVRRLLSDWYGEPVVQERFGCTFYWFDADGLNVRLKDSFGATMRAPKCNGCKSYCQEGVYGVKHSAEGWFTTCPSNREDLGVLLDPTISDDELLLNVRRVLRDVQLAAPDDRSFERLCSTHELTVATSEG